jgi:hypothetical protein
LPELLNEIKAVEASKDEHLHLKNLEFMLAEIHRCDSTIFFSPHGESQARAANPRPFRRPNMLSLGPIVRHLF